MDIMVKGSGSIREGRAEDGKLCSHLEWPNASKLAVLCTSHGALERSLECRVLHGLCIKQQVQKH